MSDQRIELGALWKKRSERTGNEYYTGDIRTPGGDVIKVIAFDNDRKTKDSQPDIRLYLQEDRQGGGSGYQQRSAAPSRAQAPVRETPPPIEYPTEDIDPDDIPF